MKRRAYSEGSQRGKTLTAITLIGLFCLLLSPIIAQPVKLSHNQSAKSDFLLQKGQRLLDRGEWQQARNYWIKGYHLTQKNNPCQHADFCLRLADLEQTTARAHNYLQEARMLARRSGCSSQEIEALSSLGTYYAMRQDFKRSRKFLLQSIWLAQKKQDLPGESRSRLNLGNIDYYQGNWTAAVNNYVKSAGIKRKLGDLEGMAMIHNNIAAIYKEQGRYRRSLEYYLKTANYYSSTHDTLLLAETRINIAIVYIFSGKKDKAIDLLKKALQALVSSGGSPETILVAQTNLGFAYTETKNLHEALRYLTIAEKAAREQTDDHTLAVITNLFGANYFYLGDYPKANRYYTQSYALSSNLGLLKEQQKAAFGLYETEQRAGNYRQALIWHERYANLTDTLFDSESQQRLADLEEKYYTSQKLQKITWLSARNKAISLKNQLTSNQLNLALVSGAFILLGIVFMGVLFYQRSKRQQLQLEGIRQRHNEQVNKLISDQEIGLLAATIDAQHNERKKLAKDIHDNLGSYLATLKYQHEAVSPDENDPELLAHYTTTSKLIAGAFAEVRSISHQMATGLTISFSLIPAIEELINRIRTTRQFAIELYCYPEEMDVPGEIGLHLYKIVQELLSNILKHSRASMVALHIHCDNSSINLMIEDNGIGFDPSVVYSGIGLANIRERVLQLQGKLEMNSLSGKGTTVVLILPLIPLTHDSTPHSG